MGLIIHRCVADLHFEDFPDTVLLFEMGCAHPALRVTGNIEMTKKTTRKSITEAAGASNTTSAKIRPIINFFGADVQSSFAFSVALKPINLKILPDGTIYSTSHPGKWIQIQIRMDETEFNLHDS